MCNGPTVGWRRSASCINGIYLLYPRHRLVLHARSTFVPPVKKYIIQFCELIPTEIWHHYSSKWIFFACLFAVELNVATFLENERKIRHTSVVCPRQNPISLFAMAIRANTHSITYARIYACQNVVRNKLVNLMLFRFFTLERTQFHHSEQINDEETAHALTNQIIHNSHFDGERRNSQRFVSIRSILFVQLITMVMDQLSRG